MTTDPSPAAAPASRAAGRRQQQLTTRLVAGSLSAAATLGLMGAMAGPADIAAPADVSLPAPTPPTMVIVRRTSGPPNPASAAVAPVAPRVVGSAATPVTSSQAS
jgi:hypothetical protein